MIVLILTILALFLRKVLALDRDCNNGCLVCSSGGICLLCDSSRFYLRSGYDCVQETIEHCTKTFDGSNCLQCETGFYLDPTTNNCVAIQANITNCQVYNSSKTCAACESSYYLELNQTCSKIAKEIIGCLKYQSASLCEVCANSTLSDDKASCNSQVKKIQNCALYSPNINCTSCASGTYYQPNKYLIDIQKDPSFLQSFYAERISSVNATVFASKPTNVCVRAVDNCLQYQDYSNCTNCASGYYSSQGFCLPNPTQSIGDCLVYFSDTICTLCNPNFYLNQSQCLPHDNIANCLNYHPTNGSACLECGRQFFFNDTLGTCVLRTLKILNCDVFAPNNETCAACKEGYQVSPSQTKCFQVIQKCTQHLFLLSANGDYSIICNNCMSGFYIKTQIVSSVISTTCELPSLLIEGCSHYQTEEICIECQNGFFLANFKCHPHNKDITSKIACDQYSTTISNTCSKCPDMQFLYQIYNYCEDVTSSISKCNIYSSNGVCAQCSDTYFLTVDNRNIQSCNQTNIQNCLRVEVNQNICLACDSSKNLVPSSYSQGNACVEIPDYISRSCASLVVNAKTNEYYCETCNVPDYPKNFMDQKFQFCVSQEQLTNFKTGLSDTDIANLSGCNTFDFVNKACLICDQGGDKPLVNSTSKFCDNTCNFGDEVIVTFEFKGSSPSGVFVCKGISAANVAGDNPENCKRVEYNVTAQVTTSNLESAIKQMCAECKDGFIPLVTATNSYNYTHYDFSPLKHLGGLQGILSYFSSAIKRPLYWTCVPWDPTTMKTKTVLFADSTFKMSNLAYVDFYTAGSVYFAQNWDNFKNCKAALQIISGLNEYYACGACKFGFTGIVISSLSSIGGVNFMHSCLNMTDCDSSVYYGAIGSHDDGAMLDYHVSCHACQDKIKIVTITDRKPWSKIPDGNEATQTFTDNLSSGGYYAMVTCNPPGYKSTFGDTFPKNCTIQQIVPSKKMQAYTADASIIPNPVCIACAPGFRAKLFPSLTAESNYHYVRSCEQINSCKSSNLFNVCEVCNDGYVLSYVEGARGLTDGSTCVVNAISNCVVGEELGMCHRCANGFVLNMAGFCDPIPMDKCVRWGTVTPLASAFEYLTSDPFGQGCLVCKEGSYSVRFDFNPQICVSNVAKPDSANSLASNHFVDNCQIYTYDSNKGLLCKNCILGYYIADNGKNCTRQVIANCVKFGRQNPNLPYVCVACDDGFYLDQGRCSAGSIKGCLQYLDSQNCLTCTTKHVATRINFNQFTICMNVTDSVSNCLNFDINSGFDGILNCLQCSSSTFPNTFDIPVKTCARFYSIANCLAYDLKDRFSQSTFFCTNCTQPFFISSDGFPSRCIARANYPILNCRSYLPDSDFCFECIPNFYLASNHLKCLPNPDGINGCRAYASFRECSECQQSFYPANKQCQTVPTDKAVANCYTYGKDLSCLNCTKGYKLQSPNCVAVVVENCQTPGFGDNCESCASGYQFIAGKCVQANLANCLAYSSITECKACQKGYFLNAGRCYEPDVIPGCLDFDSKSTCVTCDKQFSLSADRTKCDDLSQIIAQYKNPDCKVYVEANACVYCDPGYYFNGNQCILCGTNLSSCQYCDYRNTTLCLMCQSGYHMLKNKTCVVDTPPPNNSASQIFDPDQDYLVDNWAGTLKIAGLVLTSLAIVYSSA